MYTLIRIGIYTYAKTYINEISEFQPNLEISKNKYLDTPTYIRNMGEDKYWVGDIEMQLVCYIFGIKIAIYKSEVNENNEEEESKEIEDEDEEKYYFIIIISLANNDNEKIPIMILNYKNINHYELLYFKHEKEESNNLNKENLKLI